MHSSERNPVAEPAIEVSGLVKSFGDVRALDGVDLEAAPGTVLGVLGPNGAGKTTAVRILTTLLAARRRHAPAWPASTWSATPAQLRSRIGLAGQYAAVDENLTGLENLTWSAASTATAAARRKARAAELLERFGLTDAGDRVGEDVLGRHAAPARPRRGAGRAPAGAVPRRADDRPRPAQPARPLGDDRGARRRRHDRAADHAVPRRGRPARRPDRGHRPRHA